MSESHTASLNHSFVFYDVILNSFSGTCESEKERAAVNTTFNEERLFDTQLRGKRERRRVSQRLSAWWWYRRDGGVGSFCFDGDD